MGEVAQRSLARVQIGAVETGSAVVAAEIDADEMAGTVRSDSWLARTADDLVVNLIVELHGLDAADAAIAVVGVPTAAGWAQHSQLWATLKAMHGCDHQKEDCWHG